MPLCYGILTLETSDCFLLPEHFEKSSSGGFEMKFLLFEAEWNVQHKSIQTSFLLLIFFSYIPTKRIIAPIYELYSIFVCLSSAF